jgi:hypothetical protein
MGVSGAPGKVPVHGHATGGTTPAEAELPPAWVGGWLPEELEVVASPPAVPDAALPTQLKGSDVEVDAVPAADVALTAAEELGEALVAEAGVDELGLLLAAESFTKEARSVVPAAMMIWELAAGSGVVGPLAAAPDPTMAALAATVARAAATGRVACQATEAPAMMVWERGLAAASATAWDVSASGAWNRVGSDDCDATGRAVVGISDPRVMTRESGE